MGRSNSCFGRKDGSPVLDPALLQGPAALQVNTQGMVSREKENGSKQIKKQKTKQADQNAVCFNTPRRVFFFFYKSDQLFLMNWSKR